MYHLMVQVIPFYLVAHLTVDRTWPYGWEITYDVQVNSLAVYEDNPQSMRLQATSKLVCQLKTQGVFSCHFRDSQANSFLTNSVDPHRLGKILGPVHRQMAYEFHEDQFEINFKSYYMQREDSLVVNENLQPRELDMIRLVVGQFYVGPVPMVMYMKAKKVSGPEKFTQGKCLTTTTVQRISDLYVLNMVADMDRDYELLSKYNEKKGEVTLLRKHRNVRACTYQTPYYFGSVTNSKFYNTTAASLESSESELRISRKGFVSETQNIIMVGHAPERVTLYESVSLRLDSISPAEDEPPEVKDPEKVSAFIGIQPVDDLEEEEVEVEMEVEVEEEEDEEAEEEEEEDEEDTSMRG